MKRPRVRWTILVSLLIGSSPVRSFADPLTDVANELATQLANDKKIRVAVLAFPDHLNQTHDGSIIVAEKLATHLAATSSVTVVERAQILEILHELRFAETGVVDPATSQQVGRLLGADVLVSGTLIDLPDQKVELNARALSSENGRVLAASRTILARSWKMRQKLDPNW